MLNVSMSESLRTRVRKAGVFQTQSPIMDAMSASLSENSDAAAPRVEIKRTSIFFCKILSI